MNEIAFFSFQKHSVFIPFKFVYPECLSLIEDHDQLSPLMCLRTSCPKNASCMDILAKRVNYLFTNVMPDAQMLIAYFKYRDRPDSIRAGVFMRDMSEPKLMTLNRSAFIKFQREGTAFVWVPTSDYLLIAPSNNIIPVESLIKR